jgi:hypothetical protein
MESPANLNSFVVQGPSKGARVAPSTGKAATHFMGAPAFPSISLRSLPLTPASGYPVVPFNFPIPSFRDKIKASLYAYEVSHAHTHVENILSEEGLNEIQVL